jgi:hypothetical protein
MNIEEIAALAAQAVREVLSAHPEPDPTGAVLSDDHLAHALAHTLLARDWQGVVGNHPMARAGALAAMGEGEAADLYLNPTNEDHLAHGLARFAMALAQRQLSGNPGEFREG